MKICMAGALGRMGRRILELAAAAADVDVGSAFDAPSAAGESLAYGSESGNPAAVTLDADAAAAATKADVLIDFTVADACLENARAAVEAGKPAVIGTTGLTDEHQAALGALSQRQPIVFAPNMSVGVNLLFKLTQEAAAALGLDYNVEITEIHHNQKVDSPSGTAVRLAECAAEPLGLAYGEHVVHGRVGQTGKRPAREIGMHVLRGGDVAGEHTVSFVGAGERIELTHRAHNRDNFARGALTAARFAQGALPGLYDMQDVLGLR